MIIFSFFIHLKPFPQVFGHVNGLLMLKMPKIKYVRQIFPCSIILIFFYEQGCRGGVFKVMKKDLLVF